MDEFFKWLASNSAASNLVMLALVLVILIYFVAFLQGRKITLWTPGIEPLQRGSRAESDLTPCRIKAS